MCLSYLSGHHFRFARNLDRGRNGLSCLGGGLPPIAVLAKSDEIWKKSLRHSRRSTMSLPLLASPHISTWGEWIEIHPRRLLGRQQQNTPTSPGWGVSCAPHSPPQEWDPSVSARAPTAMAAAFLGLAWRRWSVFLCWLQVFGDLWAGTGLRTFQCSCSWLCLRHF